ncbi:MAG: NADPH:quinone oxidoreductase [Acidiphilium sp. 37-64-53]|uniref:NADPH:quinone oxidoreductase family protein n=1 Tax=Acidiphilium TaxID=522 RepID=UPI000BDBE042|nr:MULTISPECIES: NADPH:quinone oxidoreductase family protein [Acidiphilium]OYW03531.1 MAG: NADPH:quinone oxidoreductase [Acidiphilium sp. 37-64-53]OZB29525.1 MAG: NADPH:quinone oxidoreductase [Acidiphilium sp. 34-64-41]HQT84179.1 NADPH:quinone oxidoreductase family protein [Acidiphilium rubrum]
MRAIVCAAWGGPETLQHREIADPVAREGEVVIKIHAAGVNFPDVLIIQKKYQVQPTLPFTPGAEVAGEIEAVGEGVTDFKIGDRVLALCSTGGFAEKIALNAHLCVPIPDHVPYDVAAGFILAFGTSHHALIDRGGVKQGDTVLVLGAAGGVGLAAVEIAKARGAKVIAAASNDAKLVICRDRGADATINYSTEDFRAAIKTHTEGRGPDIIFDPVGGRFAEPAFRSIAWRGRYLVIGFADGEIPSLPLNLPLLKGASLVGVFWGDFARREPKNQIAMMQDLFAMLQNGQIRPLISKAYPLADTAQALQDMADRKVTGKIVVVP